MFLIEQFTIFNKIYSIPLSEYCIAIKMIASCHQRTVTKLQNSVKNYFSYNVSEEIFAVGNFHGFDLLNFFTVRIFTGSRCNKSEPSAINNFC